MISGIDIFGRQACRVWAILVSVLLLHGCKTSPVPTGTLHDVDITRGRTTEQKVFIRPRSEEEIKQAYQAYLDDASVDEKGRINALSRLAELEYRSSRQHLGDNASVKDNALSDKEIQYQQKLSKTINLLSTSLRDYPDAPGNDRLLYQLAKAQAENNQYDASITSLQQLADKYPSSPYYVEAQFRVAEDAFSQQDYGGAEYAYSEVIFSPANEIFYEKSLFKRGWSRFKQQLYLQAVDDFLQAVVEHQFGEYEKLAPAELEQFEEYFRAIALSFSYLNDIKTLNEYFQGRTDFRYTYFSYDKLSELFLTQQRYSDAVQVHEQFIHQFPDSDNIPYSQLKIIEIWKNSGFTHKIYQAVEDFYSLYNPDSAYWKNQNENSRVNRVIRRSLKEYVILMSAYYHNRYQQKPASRPYQQAELWYRRYLAHYAPYALQDRMYFLYAELLKANRQLGKANQYYQLAAYDNELIINKDAAYTSLVITNQLLKNNHREQDELFDRYIQQATQYCQQFIKEKRSHNVALLAAQQAFNRQHYQATIELSDLLLSVTSYQPRMAVTSLKADAYFHLKDYAETEKLYARLLTLRGVDQQQTHDIQTKLSLTIYRQGEQAVQGKRIADALTHYARISQQVPQSKYAATGLYDAIALSIQHQYWTQSIELIKRFQSLYPKHSLNGDVSRKLSVAYMNADQGINAARELEKIASRDKDKKIRAAAQWQAAELYKTEGKNDAAVRAYKAYIREFEKPFARRQQAMHEIAELYRLSADRRQQTDWLTKLVISDKKALNNARTDRTRLLVSTAYLNLARLQKSYFDSLKLTLPLQKSLAQKKKTMQKAVKLYGQASVHKLYDITTEATHSIALIYNQFSESLLQSARPENLNSEELDQYEILLEDQAFPFQDKAIEFFEINLSRVKDGLYNDWIGKSHQQLVKLFPLRYDRQPRLDSYYAEID